LESGSASKDRNITSFKLPSKATANTMESTVTPRIEV
jgi:hypothetical protein